MKNKKYIQIIFIITAVLTGYFFDISESSAQTYLVNSGKMVLSGSNTFLSVENFTNGSGSSLNLNESTLNIRGNFTNSGIYDASGTMSYSGNSQQTLTGITALNNLTINNTNGVLLSGEITINNILTLANGILTLGPYNLIINSPASIAGSFSSARMINASDTGKLIKKFSSAGSFTYPIGDNSIYSPLSVNFSTGTFSEGAYLSANLKNIKHANNTSLSDYLNRFWTLTPSGITGYNYDLTLQYNTSDIAGNETNIYLGRYFENLWTLYNQANIINHTLSLTNTTSFGDFTGGQQGAMPVQLKNFYSLVTGRDVSLKWVTAKEENNIGFEIERTTIDGKGENWEKAGFVKGKGILNHQTEYIFTDKKLSAGKYKYRLKQYDNNGNYSIFYLKNEVDISTPSKFYLSQNYPNPFNPNTKIDFELPVDEKITLKVYDIDGRNLVTLINNEFKNAGYYTINVDGKNLSSGTYFYKLECDKFTQVKKMILVK